MFREETEHKGKATSATWNLSQERLSEGVTQGYVWKMDRYYVCHSKVFSTMEHFIM